MNTQLSHAEAQECRRFARPHDEIKKGENLMKPVLVTYVTMSGSTVDVASTVADEIAKQGLSVEIHPLAKVNDLSEYSAIVLGAPMAMGWHHTAIKFLEKNRQVLQHIPLAIFAMAVSLTWMGETEVGGVPVSVDAKLGRPLQKPGRPSFKERATSLNHYAAPILKAAAPARPISLAFFGGQMDYKRLKLPALLFVRLIIQAPECDLRNWDLIRSWTRDLASRLAVRSAVLADTLVEMV
jgi:menaquinone-dependent protoporphyrinogen IX oxidase